MSTIRLVTTRDDLSERAHEAVASLGSDSGLELQVSDPTGAADDGPVSFAKQLIDDDPLVVVIDIDDVEADMFEVAAEIDRLRGDIGLVFITPPTPRSMRSALRAGVRDLLKPDASTDEIAAAIERVLEVAVRRRSERAGIDGGSSTKVIAVLSPKGGAGKTMLATSLAVGLATVHPREVCLIDLDLQFGDVANALRLVPERTFSHAVSSGLLDAAALKLDLVPHSSGLFALCAPEDPGEADEIHPPHVARIISLLSSTFSHIIVDTDPGLGEHTLALIEQATDLVFVCATDVSSVRGLNKELAALDRIGMTEQRRHFVLNRSDAKVGLTVEAIGETVELGVDVFVPSSRAVPLAMNQGVSLLEGDETTPVTKPLWQLVKRFTNAAVPIDQPPTRSSGFLRRN